MTYYLETNAVRILSNKLPQYVSNSFTSAFTIVELISGVKNEFHLRKKVIDNIFNSGIEIKWQLPDNIIAGAYSSLECEERRIGDLMKLYKVLRQSGQLEDFEEKCKEQGIHFDLGYFENYKNNLSSHFISSTIKGNTEIQKIFNDRKQALLDNPDEEPALKKKPALELFQKEAAIINRSITIYAFAKNYADVMYGSSVKEEHYQEVYDSYNEKVNYFIEALSYYTIEKMIHGSQPSRNDLGDLSHFVYLGNDSAIQMLSNDRLLLDISDELWNDSGRVRPVTSV